MAKIIIETNFSVKNASFAILEFRNDAWLVGVFQFIYICAVSLNMCIYVHILTILQA